MSGVMISCKPEATLGSLPDSAIRQWILSGVFDCQSCSKIDPQRCSGSVLWTRCTSPYPSDYGSEFI